MPENNNGVKPTEETIDPTKFSMEDMEQAFNAGMVLGFGKAYARPGSYDDFMSWMNRLTNENK